MTDVWDDIRELTSGFFAGNEAFRDAKKNRVHKQQTPVALLLRIILSSTSVGNLVFDPCSGTGTTMVVAKPLGRNAIGIEIDPVYVELTKRRLEVLREADSVSRSFDYYKFTPDIEEIWSPSKTTGKQQKLL